MRVRRICSKLEDFDKHVLVLAGHFLNRGYPLLLIEDAIIKARRLDRPSLLAPPKKPSTSEEQNILVTTYHPNDSCLSDIVFNNWDMLGRNLNTDFLHKKTPRVAYRRPKNLRDLLVKADISLTTKKGTNCPVKLETCNLDPNKTVFIPENRLCQPSISNFLVKENDKALSLNKSDNAPLLNCQKPLTKKKNCFNPKCKYCPLLDKSGQIECHSTGATYFTKENVSCLSSNLIYAINCKRCGMHYVGQTKRPLMHRLQEHLRSITQSTNARLGLQNPESFKPQPVGIHFSTPDHIGKNDVKIQILDFVHFHPDSKKAETVRLRVEKKWIHRLRCPAPYGMNIFD
jgi:hypothetical protein